jgi:hypothetical protein
MRGKNIYPYVISTIAKQYYPLKRVVIATEVQNEPSIKGILKAGFEERYRVNVGVRMGKIKITKTNSQAIDKH